jgi:hypothetical protein
VKLIILFVGGFRVIFAAGKFLPSRRIAIIGGMYLTEPLSSKNGSDIHTDWWKRFSEMSLRVMVYISSFMKISSGVIKFLEDFFRHYQIS